MKKGELKKMCTQKDIEKIDSGKYIVVNKNEHRVKLYFPIIALSITLLTFIVSGTWWSSSIDSHIKDENVHMPYEKKIKEFMTRTEIKEKLDTIEGKQDLMLKMMMEKK